MDVMPNRFVKAGQPVFSEGDAPDEGLYYICYGTVEVSREEPDGVRKLADLSEGSVFGEMAIINTDARNATVTAKTDCGFFIINRQNFQHKVEQLDPFMRGVFRVLVLELRDFATIRNRWLEIIEQGLVPPEAAKAMDQVHYELARDRDIGGSAGLSSGEARKLQF